MTDTIPQSLRDVFAAKKLIPIVGAGVSMALKNKTGDKLFPSWSGLLERAAKKLEDENKPHHAAGIRAAIGMVDFQQAADFARKGLTGGLWNQFFKETFSVERASIDDASLALPQAIWRLSNRLITLNYDRVLRFACPSADDLSELDNTNQSELADFNRGNHGEATLWHLHGRLGNLSSIIFTSESYSKLYLEKDSAYKAALATFRDVCRDSTLLFVGCSMTDADLLQQLGSVHDLFAGNSGPHYALVRKKDEALIREKLKQFDNIEIICFSEFGQPLIDQINAIVTPPAPPPAPGHTPASAPAGAPTSASAHTGAPASTLTRKPRMAVLSAHPIAKNYQYDPLLLKEIKSFKCEVSYFPLNVKSLNALDGFNYIVILSKLVKHRVAIEDDMLQSQFVSFKTLEESIGMSDPDGVLIFLDHADTTEFNADDLAALRLPTLIFPKMEKAQIESLAFKLFKKADVKLFNDRKLYAIANDAAFKLRELKGKYEEVRIKTRLPESIDPKTTENYVGRSTDLENICRKVIELQDQNRVLTIKGSGGIGKTMTVKKIAVELAARGFFADGIDFIDCEFIPDFSTFEKKVAANFNLEAALHIRQQIKDNFARQDKLIILDNVETLLHLPGPDAASDSAAIKDFIHFICDYATLVTTSREVLDLACEDVYELRRFNSDEAFDLFMQELSNVVPSTEEKRLIRAQIVEVLLDNNPLAIKLVAKNIPKGKSFTDLAQELENDIFRKASESELEIFDHGADGNIERKKSLYASIHFSYRHLNEDEKKVFEILSLFPDGIDLVNLKRIADNRRTGKSKGSTKPAVLAPALMITDVVIKALEKKSMTQVDNNQIKLQSIVGKFAERQLAGRSEQERTQYYHNAAHYLMGLVQNLRNLWFDNGYRAGKAFHAWQGNFFKSVHYIDAANLQAEAVLDYLDDLVLLAGTTSLSGALAQAIAKKTAMFKQDAAAQRCFDVLLLSARYFAGDFAHAYAQLQKQMPLPQLAQFNPSRRGELIMAVRAISIYSMEGAQVANLALDIKMQWQDSIFYPDYLCQLGEFAPALLAVCKINFFTLDAKLASGQLTPAMVDAYLATRYEKDHLELMQCHYLKAKLGVMDKNRIKKLATINPYTVGLQKLMLTMAETALERKHALFEAALLNLQHIKYYYVEAHLIYARHLQQAGQAARYAEIHQKGLALACEHHYRFLRYQFEDLTEKKTEPYSSATYPLPDVGDLAGHIQMLIKRAKAG
jgi:SIR2-like domain